MFSIEVVRFLNSGFMVFDWSLTFFAGGVRDLHEGLGLSIRVLGF